MRVFDELNYGLLILVPIFAVLVLNIQLILYVRSLKSSFNKIGYILREDAKKYFDDAAIKIVDTNAKFREDYAAIVEEGTRLALKNNEEILQQMLSEANEKAGDIILRARESAQRINVSAKSQIDRDREQAITQATEAINWTLREYVNTKFSNEDHNAIINSLLERYLNGRR